MAIRPAREADIPAILPVFTAARNIMHSSGNTRQWPEDYPSATSVREDIARDGAFVLEEEGRIVAYFAFLPSPEPTYRQIFGGAWLDDALPYHVIHRIASYPDVHGVFASIIGWARERENNLRIDTHRDNRIMQHNILKHGFRYCGIILLESGDERLAFQSL